MKNLTGKKFGRLTVVSSTKERLRRSIKWLCKCECGNETKVVGYSLQTGNTKSCGCIRNKLSGERAKKQFRADLVGKKFGRLIVVDERGSTKLGHSKWLCRCDCGNEKIVLGQVLVRGDSKSCGCITMELLKNSVTHPAWQGGKSFEPYCDVWKNKEYEHDILKRDDYRCQNPDCRGTSVRLDRHHIDYNKKNCSPNNIITLCASCNARANFKREWHTNYYNEIMQRRGLC